MSVITKEIERKYWERFENKDYPTIEEMRKELTPFDKEVRLYLLRKRGNQLVEITKGKNNPTQEQRFQMSRTYMLLLDNEMTDEERARAARKELKWKETTSKIVQPKNWTLTRKWLEVLKREPDDERYDVAQYIITMLSTKEAQLDTLGIDRKSVV